MEISIKHVVNKLRDIELVSELVVDICESTVGIIRSAHKKHTQMEQLYIYLCLQLCMPYMSLASMQSENFPMIFSSLE